MMITDKLSAAVMEIPPYLPVYSIGDCSSGKFPDFFEQVLAKLMRRGFQVAVVHADTVQTDNHLREYGATDCLIPVDKHQYFLRGTRESLLFQLRVLARTVDVVLVNTTTQLDLPKILLGGGSVASGSELLDLSCFIQDTEMALQRLVRHMQRKMALRPVWACILIGGKSSRMGRPKHLLTDSSGASWLERTVHLLRPLVAGIALSGRGEIPSDLQDLARLADIPDVSGPLTGILSAMRWQPDVSWLLVACDMPAISRDALVWLINQQQPGRWGCVPKVPGNAGVEPLLARYEPQCKAPFEMMSACGIRRISRIADVASIGVVDVPECYRSAWLNVNTPLELEKSNL